MSKFKFVSTTTLNTTITQQIEKNTNLAKLRIKKQHMDTKLQEGESAEVHIRVMKELTDHLAMITGDRGRQMPCFTVKFAL